MRLLTCACVLLWAASAAAAPPDRDALQRARTAYNHGRFDAAIGGARNALSVPAEADGARLVLGRALLERYRANSDPRDLDEARVSLQAIDPLRLDPIDRTEWLIGFGQWLYFTRRFGAAAELFEDAASRPLAGGTAARDRLLDWWATALERETELSPDDRDHLNARILERMDAELERDPGSIAANYWTVAAARAIGDLERAWNASMAAWVRARLAGPTGYDLRTDIDRLVLTGIIPDRARSAAASRGLDQRQVADTLVTEWERFKQDWEQQPSTALPGDAPTAAAALTPSGAPR